VADVFHLVDTPPSVEENALRVLVVGASGYIGSRVIPALLNAGHQVLAGARDTASLTKFWWFEQVTPVQIDVLDEQSTNRAITQETDAIVYLVHGMASDDFSQADRQAALNVRNSADTSAVRRIVYVSGIIPNVSTDDLSEHLKSRLQVEEVLSSSNATVITLRAAMVIGGGSTSYELMSQLSDRLPMTIVPDWMNHLVEPIAVVDLVDAIIRALEAKVSTRNYDIGGGEPLPYPDLIQRYTEEAEKERIQLPLGFLPEKLVAQVAAWIADVPSPTVKALMESLQHDMKAGDQYWKADLAKPNFQPLTVKESLRRSLNLPNEQQPDETKDPMQRWSSDPTWT